MTDAAEWVASRIGYRFVNEGLLREALTHRSAHGRRHNERLEFLGDAALSLLVADALFRLRTDEDEGSLSRLRAQLVRGSTLAEIAQELDLGRYLVLGTGELKSGGFRRSSILADALEAVFGAIYVDGGLESLRACVERLFASRLERLPRGEALKDAKTRLQEWLQGRGEGLPVYALERVEGAEHAQRFTVSCTLPQRGLAFSGEGSSRRRAEQAAAGAALTALETEA